MGKTKTKEKPVGTSYILSAWGTLLTLEEYKQMIAEKQ